MAKSRGSLAMRTLSIPHPLTKIFYMPAIQAISMCTRFTAIFDCSFANPQFWGRGGRRGSGMVPFERVTMTHIKDYQFTMVIVIIIVLR